MTVIRQGFNSSLPDLPPRYFLEQVFDGVCKLYCWLWDRQDKECCVDYTWEELAKTHDRKSFRSRIRKLGNQGLLDYKEDNNGVHIQLIGWDDVVNDLD